MYVCVFLIFQLLLFHRTRPLLTLGDIYDLFLSQFCVNITKDMILYVLFKNLSLLYPLQELRDHDYK